jgi:flagellar assembly factor FliW
LIIKTKFFHEIEVEDDSMIQFKQGLLGFEDVKGYVLIDMDDKGFFKCLQSIDSKDTAFVVINPWTVFKDYEIDIDDNDIDELGSSDINDYAVYSVVTIGSQSMTANLIGPLVINVKTGLGRQFVLHNSAYTTKHIIKSFEKKEE